jgi:hypothetical protein
MVTAKSARLIVAGVVVSIAIFFSVKFYRISSLSEQNETFFINLADDAERLNATLPEMVSENIRLDKATAGPGNSFHYNYTIVDNDAATKIAGDPEELSKLKMQLQERVCDLMPAYRANGTIVNYALRDNAGAVIADISINPRDCV